MKKSLREHSDKSFRSESFRIIGDAAATCQSGWAANVWADSGRDVGGAWPRIRETLIEDADGLVLFLLVHSWELVVVVEKGVMGS